MTGRTYGNFEYNTSRAATISDAAAVTIAGNLTLTAGTLNLTGGAILQGNVLLNGGALNFAPASAATIQLAGTTAQTIGGIATSGPTFNAK